MSLPNSLHIERPRTLRLGTVRPLPNIVATTLAGRYLVHLRWLFTGRR